MGRHLTLAVLVAALSAWLLAWAFGDPAWIGADDVPVGYGIVLILKSAFLAALKAVIAPVIFFSLLGGVVSIGSATRLRTLGGVTLAWYLGTTIIAIVIGLSVVLFVHPWEAMGAPTIPEATPPSADRLIGPGEGSWVSLVSTLLSRALVNPFTALAELNILAIVTNAIVLGVGMLLVVPADSPLRAAVEDLTRIVYRVLGWVVLAMPVGVFAIVFDLVLKVDTAMLWQLAAFCGVVLGATLLHGLVVLPAAAWLLGGIGPVRLFAAIARPLVVAFSTSSSSATLPVSLRAAEEHLGVSRATASFVLPLGATMNMDGTALFEGIAAVFLAWLFGIELGTLSIVAIFLMAMASSIGAPGMPSGSMAGMQMVLIAAGIPLEAIGILLLVERPLDTFRTAVNVEGDLIGALVVDRMTARA